MDMMGTKPEVQVFSKAAVAYKLLYVPIRCHDNPCIALFGDI